MHIRPISILTTAVFALIISVGIASSKPVDDKPLIYHWNNGQGLKFKISANIKGKLPLFESEPTELEAVLNLVYLATPKATLQDGSSDIDLSVQEAEAIVANVPFPIPVEDVQKTLGLTANLSKSGQVMTTRGGEPLPYKLSIPGIDPKRLYSLLFPVIFPNKSVKPGDTWSFPSQLLGEKGSQPKVNVTMLQADPEKPKMLRFKQVFSMSVDQKLDEKKNEVTDKSKIYKTRKGLITGSGVFNYDPKVGYFTGGELKLLANIEEKILVKPKTPDELVESKSNVDATIKVTLDNNLPPKANK